MQDHNKREQILNTMQELMSSSNAQAISVGDIAQKAEIEKGSIYYYFSSKNGIIDVVIECPYSRMLDADKELAIFSHMDAFRKVELIYHVYLDSSMELGHQEAIGTFSEQQESAFIHQGLACIITTRLRPVLTDTIRQGTEGGIIHCEYPEETAWTVLAVLTITLDNNLISADQDQIGRTPTVFTQMQEKSVDVPAHTLEFVLRKS